MFTESTHTFYIYRHVNKIWRTRQIWQFSNKSVFLHIIHRLCNNALEISKSSRKSIYYQIAETTFLTVLGSLNGKFLRAKHWSWPDILIFTNNQTHLGFSSNLNHRELNSESDGLCSRDAPQIDIALLEGPRNSSSIANWYYVTRTIAYLVDRDAKK